MRNPHHYHDPELERMALTARDLGSMMAGGFNQYSEQAILSGMFGNCCGCVRTTIAAAATAQTTINTGSIATGGVSGNMDQTPNTTAFIQTGTPGTAGAINTYTAPHSFLLTGSAATALTIVSQSVGLAVTVGDYIFLGGSSSAGGSTTAGGPMWMLNHVYLGLSTSAPGSGSAAAMTTMLAAEPTATGSYARVAVANNQAAFPLASAASPSVITCNGSAAPFSFPASTAAWSTGATAVQTLFITDSLTLGAGNVLAWGPLTTAYAVNASGITLSFASAALTISLT